VGHPGFPDRDVRSIHPATRAPRAVPGLCRSMLCARGQDLRGNSRLRARNVPGRTRRTLLPQEALPAAIRPPGAHRLRDQSPLRRAPSTSTTSPPS
jgi:hypothetical protein